MPYTFIWKIKLKDESVRDAFIQNWHAATVVLQEYPGAAGTTVYKSIDEENTYVIIALWESKAARDFMEADTKTGKSDRAKRWREFSKNDAFGEVTIVGRGEEIDKVLPVS